MANPKSQQEVDNLLSLAEGSGRVDFKRSCRWPLEEDKAKVQSVLMRLANANPQVGGAVELGREDNGRRVGLVDKDLQPVSERELKAAEQKLVQIAQDLDPPMTIQWHPRLKDGTETIVVLVPGRPRGGWYQDKQGRTIVGSASHPTTARQQLLQAWAHETDSDPVEEYLAKNMQWGKQSCGDGSWGIWMFAMPEHPSPDLAPPSADLMQLIHRLGRMPSLQAGQVAKNSPKGVIGELPGPANTVTHRVEIRPNGFFTAGQCEGLSMAGRMTKPQGVDLFTIAYFLSQFLGGAAAIYENVGYGESIRLGLLLSNTRGTQLVWRNQLLGGQHSPEEESLDFRKTVENSRALVDDLLGISKSRVEELGRSYGLDLYDLAADDAYSEIYQTLVIAVDQAKAQTRA